MFNNEDTIVNRISNSALQIFDLEDYYQEGIRTQIDVSQWLFEGIILKEKPFRQDLKNHNWEQYRNHYVALYCPPEVILPAWATVLVTTYLTNVAKKVVLGGVEEIEIALYQEVLPTIDFSVFINKPVILKGCSKKPVPQAAYIMAIQRLQKVAKSIMYGEACSAVPLFKQ